MTTKEMLESVFIKDNGSFNIIVEDMRRKANKGLLQETPDELENLVQGVYDREAMYELLESEADDAIDRLSYLIEE